MKHTIWLWTFWDAALASFPLPTFPFLKRKAAGTIRIADHKSFDDEIRGRDREDGGNDHHQDKEHSFSFAEFAFVGSRWLSHFVSRLIAPPNRAAFFRISAGERSK